MAFTSSTATRHNPSTLERPCALGSAAGLTKRNGELLAVVWPQAKTGFKNAASYGAKPTFNDDT